MTFFLIVLGLPAASYRLTRLLTKDTFPPVLWLRDRLAGGWRKLSDKEREVYFASNEKVDLIKEWEINKNDLTQRYVRRMKWSPSWLAELITCPWCASAYISAVVTVYGASWSWYSWPVALILWLYSWSVAAIVASKEWA